MTKYDGEAGKRLAKQIELVRCNQPLQYSWNGRLGPVLGRCDAVYNVETGETVGRDENGIPYDHKLKVHIPEHEIHNLDGGLGCAGHNYVGKVVVPVEKVNE